MLTSTEIQEEKDLHERLARLEAELAAARAREESARAALSHLRKELQAANARSAQQQEKLKLLADRATTPSLRDADLSNPTHPWREIAANHAAAAAREPERLDIVHTSRAARVTSLWESRPTWIRGAISRRDALFLDAVIERIRPDEVHEIGVASGTSSALILDSMSAHAPAAPVWLHSYDLTPDCYFDAARKVGDATREMVPSLLQRWKLDTGATALNVQSTGARPLYFIDANHVHPWPTFDLIALLPCLRPGDAVVLHDINLCATTEGKFQDFGAQWLFQEWLGPRLVPDIDIPNIGAIFIPHDIRLVLPSLIRSLLRPWAQSGQPDATILQRCEHLLTEFLARHRIAAQ